MIKIEKEKKHIGVAVFNILKKVKNIRQNELIKLLELQGYKRHKILLYLRYILTTTIQLEKGDFFGIPIDVETEPMIFRIKNDLKNEINIELNEEWLDVDEKNVIDLFNRYNPDNF